MNYAILDHLLMRLMKRVEFQDGEWVWIETFDNGNELAVHGTPYSREEAYEDALRDSLGIDPIDDELAQPKS